jgi:hypothetical protein
LKNETKNLWKWCFKILHKLEVNMQNLLMYRNQKSNWKVNPFQSAFWRTVWSEWRTLTSRRRSWQKLTKNSKSSMIRYEKHWLDFYNVFLNFHILNLL